MFITLTDLTGNVLISKRAGLLKFKGAKKKTPYVAGLVLKELILELQQSDFEIKTIRIQVNGYIRNSAVNRIIKQLSSLQMQNIIFIEYINKKIHNGLRLKKKRRL